MGAMGSPRSSIPTTGIPTLDGDYEQFLDLVGELLELEEHATGCAGPMLVRLTSLIERHAGHIEGLLQRANSDALRAARRGHETALLHLERLQETVVEPLTFLAHLHRVCGYVMAVLVQDAAAVRRCGAGVTVH